MSAWTQADIDKLDRAYGSGALRVKIGERDIQLRSVEDYERIRGIMQASVNGQGTTKSQYRFVTRTGLGR